MDEELLFDARSRATLARFTGGEDTAELEAAAALRAAARGLERLQSRATGHCGLSPGALDVLISLNASPDGRSVKELAQAAGVTSRNVTGLVDTLERAGLAARAPDPRDRRSVRVRLTPAGLTWLDEFRQPTRAAMAACFRGFTAAETTLLRHLCLRLVANQRHLIHYLEDHP
ncbi:DNA-binding MarR family transcriptional regulator [Actinoplanes octamycinicus]|uniref:DNA-binding MarR family transcriptional regulator n=1 Tax=Actinoplanes octamycinicus TaxID=135948 RepID=A0A7W7M9H9_9ACTN|nr:MarR family transcriptional regulator [Actinoplanes octamycinicus]MBB4741840.1 DNA-binding MarR family transcriptional regulator [Actinoplanes octamycinicus]GIE60604.1 MarR family transcriptional regulator [Actinoplanes octamycinicus]